MNKNSKKINLCCFFNYNPLYRLPIFKAIDSNFKTDFFFGDNVFEPIKQFDPNELSGFKRMLKAKKIGIKGYVWHSNAWQIFSTKYTHFILTGDYSYLLNWLIILFALIFRKKVFFWTHGVNYEITNTKRRLILKTFFKFSSGILLYNNYNIPYMVKLGIDKNKIHVIHNSLDTNVQTDLYNNGLHSDIYKRHFKNTAPTIIYIGRIQKRKKVDQILEALKLLKNQGHLINFVVVGGVTNDVGFIDKITKYELNDQVWIYGPSYNEKNNAELIFNSSVCVSPGNVGLTCIHSLTYGTPVISNDNFSTQMPEFESIIPEQTGSFFKEDNISSLANEILKWVKLSEEERGVVRSKCREIVLKEWSVSYQINLLRKVLY